MGLYPIILIMYYYIRLIYIIKYISFLTAIFQLGINIVGTEAK